MLFNRISLTVALLLTVCFWAGCTSNGVRMPKIPPKSYQATNVYALEYIPATMIRIAVLPADHPYDDPSTLERFDSTILTELSKKQLFEMVPVSRDYMKKHFGVRQINSTQSLPISMMARISEDFQAQGVLFTDVTQYHPYRPIRIGIRSKIADIRSGELVWVFDDVFDSAQPDVTAASRRYAREVYYDRFPLDSADSMLHSPQRFSHYVLHEAFATLPPR